jgi:hypothetical protein
MSVTCFLKMQIPGLSPIPTERDPDSQIYFRSEVSILWPAAKCGLPPVFVQPVICKWFYIFQQSTKLKGGYHFLICEKFTGI